MSGMACVPNRQPNPLNKLPPGLQMQNFFFLVEKHRLKHQAFQKKNIDAMCVHVATELPFLRTTVGGWVGTTSIFRGAFVLEQS